MLNNSLPDDLPNDFLEELLNGLSKVAESQNSVTITHPTVSSNQRPKAITPEKSVVEYNHGISTQQPKIIIPEKLLAEENVGQSAGPSSNSDGNVSYNYDRLFQLTNDILCIISLDGYFQQVNPALAKVLGYAIEELSNKSFSELVHKDDRVNTNNAITKLNQGHQIISFKNRCLCQTGRYKLIAWNLVIDPETNLIYASGRDVTTRYQMETELKSSTAELLALFNAIQDVIIVLDSQGKYLKIAPTAAPLLYQLPSEILGKNLHEVFPKETADLFIHNINQVIETGQPARLEYNIKIDHRTIYFDATIAPMQGDTVVLVARDITARKKAEMQLAQRTQELEKTLQDLQRTQSQLIQSEKMSSLGQTAAGVAHEINNPVSFIHGNLSYLGTYVKDLLKLIEMYQQYYPKTYPEITAEIDRLDLDFLREDVQKILKSMQSGTDRIQDIVKSLRSFSRLDESEVKAVNIHEGIDSALMILQHRLKSQSWRPEISVIKDYGNLPFIECYAGELNQVFMNILINAIEALEERDRNRSVIEMIDKPSEITITTKVKDKQSIIISIADNGPGMTGEISRKVFDHFFTTKPVGKGTGLGLSISYQVVVERHKGKLSCQSQLGTGSEFAIEIPMIAT